MPLATFAWWLSIKQASRLVSAHVADTRLLIDKTSATSAEWDAIVVPRVLKLINETLPVLSKGCADALVATAANHWVNALGWFALLLNGDDGPILAALIFSALMPLGLAPDVAGASSDCDSIATSLNDKLTESKLDARRS